jgi:hypothetical protein
MKKLLILLSVVAFAACSQTKPKETKPASALDFASGIDSTYLYKHLSVIASDSLEGRDTGSKGQTKAANYIIEQYKRLGVKGGMGDGSYLQPVELNSTKVNSVSFKISVTERTEEKDKKGKIMINEDVKVMESMLTSESVGDIVQIYGGEESFTSEVVFAGIGVSDVSRGVQPFEGVDVKGKMVLVFMNIPSVVEGDTVLNPALNNSSRYREVILGLGAKGLLMIPETEARFMRNAEQAKASIGKTGGLRLAYLDEKEEGLSFSYCLINPNAAAKLLGLTDTTALKNKYTEITKNLKSFKASPLNASVEIAYNSAPVKVISHNIVGVIEGSDPVLKNEYVVVSAHYDHLGIGTPDKNGDKIYNGADDDGSGTVGILSVAETLTKAKNAGVGPKRSVIILHVTGEEKGLLGSRFYSDHTTVPVEQIIADVNVDMIGRIDDDYVKAGEKNYVYIIGGSIISSAMDSLLQVANNETVKMKLDMKYNDLNDPNQFYRRSDHWNFGRLGIPFSFFFNGTHPEYHRPGDDISKIVFDEYARRAQLVYAYTIELANMIGRPKVDNQEFINKTKSNPR